MTHQHILQVILAEIVALDFYIRTCLRHQHFSKRDNFVVYQIQFCNAGILKFLILNILYLWSSQKVVDLHSFSYSPFLFSKDKYKQ